MQGAHFEEGKVLVRQRWAWWRRWWSYAVCAPFAFHPLSGSQFEIFFKLINQFKNGR